MVATGLGLKDKSTSARRSIDDRSLTGTRKEYTDTYLVATTSTNDQDDEVMSATNIPLLRSLGRNAYLREKIPREITAGKLWEVDCVYDSHIEEEEPVVRTWWTDEEIEEPLMFDQVTGLPIVNAVGELHFITTSVQLQTLNIRRIEPAPFNPNIPRIYGGRVNSAIFYGAPAGTARLKGPSTSPRAIGGQLWEEVHYQVQFNFRINPATLALQGWLYHYANRGSKFKLNAGDVEANGRFLVDGDRTKGNLNLNSTARAANLAPIWLSVNRFPIADLNDLNLGPF